VGNFHKHLKVQKLMNVTTTDIIQRIKVDKEKLGITLFTPASLRDISNYEIKKGIKLPDDLVKFYTFSNGIESAEDMFRIIPIDELIDNIKDRDTYIVGLKDFHFAEYMIYCDMWTISINSIDKEDYKIYNKAEDVIILTNSFAVFIDTFLNCGVFGGLYNWREDIKRLTK